MDTLLAKLTLSTALSCSSIINTSINEGIKIGHEQWQIPFCKKYIQDYDSIEFEKIAERTTTSKAGSTVSNNKIKIGPIKSGRVKVEWQSSSTNTSTTIWLKINVKKEAWVFTRSLAPESDITIDSVQHILVNIAPLISNKNIVLDSPIGKTVVRQTRKGQVVTTDTISPPPLVKRNNKIAITVRAGSLFIQAVGVAMETGWNLNDSISVMVENSTGPINAKITGKNHVLVEM